MRDRLTRLLGTALVAGGLALGAGAARAETSLEFYYPVAVGGPITKIVDGMVADFEKGHPDIKVKPIYAGSYQDTITKVLTAIKGGDVPQLSVILSVDMFTLIDEDAIVPYESLVKTEADKAWLKGFYPAFMENSQTGGKTWGIPFQRSTVVMYWNKEAFKEAGLDPETPPQTWDELVAFGKKLTKKDASGNVTRWGVQIPSSGFPYWLFQALTTQNDVRLMNGDGTETHFDDPKVVEALQYWVDLSRKWQIHAPGIVEWGTTPKDFFEGKTAIMWTTTGNLTNVRKNAPFPFGVAMLPEHARRGTPTGGGNFYIFKKSTPEQKAAALTFIEWMTSPERAAQWGIETGYVAVSPAAWETPEMKAYVKDFPPAAVARDQLQYAFAELSTHDNQRVTKALNDGLQAALTGAKTPAEAMKDSQAEAKRILRAYQ
ncbi:carbohydrate ABC transporter substrate-binding protein, CUT1 family [Tistlia consotensis]|uniref:Carbohydrate ABC transporter substrate-binding protein, CUT1 family n=1 Tax=Tistlia consotensis USBA 355 TaxID=560819 RepID=A0A1Y6CSM8_9PROT|nr:ABC transporter substrate-binding protein [Tistlia consotensis]SMF73739.1 carbohydrate ABC transporter substrate-binding protein, CUT1 family [Tistlia consotensis USBA 355]SNS28627.1 carbohydrate ABC transporter substrate-binding protein, CUT1 family [Tistlia consotensis]